MGDKNKIVIHINEKLLLVYRETEISKEVSLVDRDASYSDQQKRLCTTAAGCNAIAHALTEMATRIRKLK